MLNCDSFACGNCFFSIASILVRNSFTLEAFWPSLSPLTLNSPPASPFLKLTLMLSLALKMSCRYFSISSAVFPSSFLTPSSSASFSLPASSFFSTVLPLPASPVCVFISSFSVCSVLSDDFKAFEPFSAVSGRNGSSAVLNPSFELLSINTAPLLKLSMVKALSYLNWFSGKFVNLFDNKSFDSAAI